MYSSHTFRSACDNCIHALSFWGFPLWFSSIYPSGSNSFQHNETQYTIHLLSQLLILFQGQVLGSWSQSQHALGKGKGSLWEGYQYTPSERLVGQLKSPWFFFWDAHACAAVASQATAEHHFILCLKNSHTFDILGCYCGQFLVCPGAGAAKIGDNCKQCDPSTQVDVFGLRQCIMTALVSLSLYQDPILSLNKTTSIS